MTEVGQQSDSKATESLAAITGLVTASGGLATSLATAAKTRRETDLLQPQALENSRAAAREQIARGLTEVRADPGNAAFYAVEMQALLEIEYELKALAMKIKDPGQIPDPEGNSKKLEEILKKWKERLSRTTPVNQGPVGVTCAHTLADPALDKLLEQAGGEMDAAKRVQVYADVQKKIMDYAAWFPIHNQVNPIAYRANRTGYRLARAQWNLKFYEVDEVK